MAVSAPEYTKGKYKLHKLKEVRLGSVYPAYSRC